MGGRVVKATYKDREKVLSDLNAQEPDAPTGN
jgi:hypothetical protein